MNFNSLQLLFFWMLWLAHFWLVGALSFDFDSLPSGEPLSSFLFLVGWKILPLDPVFLERGLPASVAAHQTQNVGLPANRLFRGATFLSGLVAKVPARGCS